MAPDRRIAEDLVVLKQALGPKSERDLIVDAIAAHIPIGERAWLDVGIGDGVSTSRMLADLRSHDLSFDVVGVDPELQSGTSCPEALSARLLQTSIEDYLTDQKFDVINVRQSAYYFDDIEESILKLFSLMSPKSLMAITFWTDECFLFHLHSMIAAEIGIAPKALSLSRLQSAVNRIDTSVAVESAVITDTIDIEKIVADGDLLNATLAIAGRGFQTKSLEADAISRLQAKITSSWPKTAQRSNALVVARRTS